nr:membrane protein [Rhizobium sp. Q54]
MAHPDPEEQEEPLDPAMERIRRKMVLLQLVSGGILFVCFMAVLAAVVYKVSQRPDQAAVASSGFSVPADQPLASTVNLPAGFEVRSVSSSGAQILFYGAIAGQQKALVYDLSLGRLVADVTVGIAP